jgi:hypothetical protein
MNSKLRTILLLLSVWVFSVYSFAQDPVIDSLKLTLKNAKHDTTRCNILSQLSEICEIDDISKYALPCIKISEAAAAKTTNSVLKKIYLKYNANALNNLGFMEDHQGTNSKAID